MEQDVRWRSAVLASSVGLRALHVRTMIGLADGRYGASAKGAAKTAVIE